MRDACWHRPRHRKSLHRQTRSRPPSRIPDADSSWRQRVHLFRGCWSGCGAAARWSSEGLFSLLIGVNYSQRQKPCTFPHILFYCGAWLVHQHFATPHLFLTLSHKGVDIYHCCWITETIVFKKTHPLLVLQNKPNQNQPEQLQHPHRPMNWSYDGNYQFFFYPNRWNNSKVRDMSIGLYLPTQSWGQV